MRMPSQRLLHGEALHEREPWIARQAPHARPGRGLVPVEDRRERLDGEGRRSLREVLQDRGAILEEMPSRFAPANSEGGLDFAQAAARRFVVPERRDGATEIHERAPFARAEAAHAVAHEAMEPEELRRGGRRLGIEPAREGLPGCGADAITRLSGDGVDLAFAERSVGPSHVEQRRERGEIGMSGEILDDGRRHDPAHIRPEPRRRRSWNAGSRPARSMWEEAAAPSSRFVRNESLIDHDVAVRNEGASGRAPILRPAKSATLAT
jgi:hypothetical protein